MNRASIITALMAMAICSTVASAQKAKSESQDVDYVSWANCVWEKAPVTAQNLLLASEGKLITAHPSENVLAEPDDILEMRLDSVCGDLLPRRVRNSIFSSIKDRKRQEIEAHRPEELKTKDKRMKLFVCEHRADGMLLFTELGLKKKSKKKLEGTNLKCFSTQSDGSLVSA